MAINNKKESWIRADTALIPNVHEFERKNKLLKHIKPKRKTSVQKDGRLVDFAELTITEQLNCRK